jgi:hypothetical protein
MTKNKTWKMLLTIFFVGFLTACGDDDNPITDVDNNPFTGVDNNILLSHCLLEKTRGKPP